MEANREIRAAALQASILYWSTSQPGPFKLGNVYETADEFAMYIKIGSRPGETPTPSHPSLAERVHA